MSALHEPQRGLLVQRFRQMVLMLDGDAAGRRGSAEIAAWMAGRCRVKVIALAENRQPDQLSEEAIREILTREGGRPLGSPTSPATITGGWICIRRTDSYRRDRGGQWLKGIL